MVTYSPSLKAAQLRAAAGVLAEAASRAHLRAEDIQRAPIALTATSFSGFAAFLSLSHFPVFGARILASATMLRHGSEILHSSASMQEKLDQLAYVAMNLQRAEAVRVLSEISLMLDSHTAQALRDLTAAEKGNEGASERFADHPQGSLREIDARLTPIVASTISDEVRAADGLILETGPGGTTVIIGELVNPERITTMVAGVSTGRPEKLTGELEKAKSIAAATGGAVVVWQGYVPPRDVPRGIDPIAAREGGANLAKFQAALNERYPHAQQTVVAHSYGTVVAARAAEKDGLHVDDLWLLGSPGVAAERADKLHLIGTAPQVFVADADADPIALTRFRTEAVHGYSPASDSFGATVVQGVRGGHGAYFFDPALLTALSNAANQQRLPAPTPENNTLR